MSGNYYCSVCGKPATVCKKETINGVTKVSYYCDECFALVEKVYCYIPKQVIALTTTKFSTIQNFPFSHSTSANTHFWFLYTKFLHILQRLVTDGMISKNEGELLKIAMSDKALANPFNLIRFMHPPPPRLDSITNPFSGVNLVDKT